MSADFAFCDFQQSNTGNSLRPVTAQLFHHLTCVVTRRDDTDQTLHLAALAFPFQELLQQVVADQHQHKVDERHQN